MARARCPARKPPIATAVEGNRAGDGSGRTASWALAGCLLAAAMATATAAVAQTSPEQNLASESGALDFFRPPPNLFQLLYGYRTAPGSGASSGTTREVTTQQLNLRYDHAFDMPSGWILVTRSDLPMVARNPITDSNPNGDYLKGFGDANVQAALIHDINRRWAFGFGMRVIVPTGDDALGSGKWQLMPIVGARLALPEISESSYFEPLLRYDVSVAGDPTRRNISNLQFAPALSVSLPERWFVTFFPSPDIRINFGDPITGQTGRLFIPFDVRFGKKFTDNLALSLEVGVPIVRDYPVYDFKTQLRLNLTY
jgi:Putative MetA-pathway of phenol degradation